MIDTESYVAELKASVEKNTSCISGELIEYAENLLEMTSDAYLEAYENRNLNRMGELLNSQRKLRKEVTCALRESQNQLLVISAKLVQNYNMFNKILQIENERRNMKNQLGSVVKAHSCMEDILKYLYKHNFVKHKELVNNLSISKSTVTYSLKVLEEMECVEKIGERKQASYSLSNMGRKYVVENLDGIDAVILNADTFFDDSRQICEKKTQLMNEVKYMDDHRYMKAYGFSTKNTKWENLEIEEKVYE